MTIIYAMRQRVRADYVTICFLKKKLTSQIHSHGYFDDVMTKFMINYRLEARKTDVKLT